MRKRTIKSPVKEGDNITKEQARKAVRSTVNKRKKTQYKPPYPLIIIYARDWNMWNDLYKAKEAEDFYVARGWIAGWLIKEKDDCYIVAFETFDDGGESNVRHVDAIPKETILFKKIIEA